MSSFLFELAYILNPWYDPHIMDDAYEQGLQAFIDGLGLESNPFPEDSDDYFEWEAGWVAASEEDMDD